jgi:GAF domain-containing protein
MKTGSAEFGKLLRTVDFRFVSAPGPAEWDGSAPRLTNPRTFAGIARFVIQRTQAEEAHMWAALGRVGRELIPLHSPAMILDRLCRLTVEILGCECSHSLVWQPWNNAYGAVCGFGDTAAQWDAIRCQSLPSAGIAPLLASLARHGTAQVVTSSSEPLLPVSHLQGSGLSVCLCASVQCGSALVGIQTAGYRSRVAPFTLQQERLAAGITRLASLVLEQARLAETLQRANGLMADLPAALSASLRRSTFGAAQAARQGGRRPPHRRRRAPAHSSR